MGRERSHADGVGERIRKRHRVVVKHLNSVTKEQHRQIMLAISKVAKKYQG